MIYNYENRLAVHQAPGTLATYLYSEGGAGQMRVEEVDGFATRLIWNGLSPLEQLTRVGPIPGVNLQHFTRLQVPTPQVDGTSVSFRLPTVPVSGTETIYLNGIAQDPSGDYSISGAVFTMVEAPASTAALLASWYTDGGIAFVRMQTPTPAVNGTTTSFALAETPISGTLTVYLNGVCLHPGIGNDYTSSGSAITLAAPPASTDKLRVSYVQSALPSGVSSVVTQAPTPAVDGTTTTFEFTGQQGAETVTLNGVILQPYADYTVDETTLTMASPPAATDLLLVSSYAGLAIQTSEIFVDAVNGRILGTVNPLSDVSEYGLDALGSVTSSRNASGAVVNNYRYKPYGQMLAGFTPGQSGYFLFGGGLNYEFLNRQGAEISAGMRIFSYMTANWTTRDPMWTAGFFGNYFVYADGNPSSRIDPSGLKSEALGLTAGFQNLPSDLARVVTCCREIDEKWSKDPYGPHGLTWFHDCNHLFSHCMACCVLGKNYGTVASRSCQTFQDHLSRGTRPYLLGYSVSSACRKIGCDAGQNFSFRNAPCLQSCKARFPFNAGPTCSSTKTGTRIDCKGRPELTVMPPLPNCIGLDECHFIWHFVPLNLPAPFKM
jgi:hypothetical protein